MGVVGPAGSQLSGFFSELLPPSPISKAILAAWNNKPYVILVVAAATIAYYHLVQHQPVPLDVWGAELAVLGGAVHSSVKNS